MTKARFNAIFFCAGTDMKPRALSWIPMPQGGAYRRVFRGAIPASGPDYAGNGFWITEQINQIERLYSENVPDMAEVERYLNVDTFVDYFIINEFL